MAPRTKEQFENIRQSSKQKIIDAALEIFAKNGYHNSSVSSIAAKAGISKGLMYNYFKSKDEMLKTIIKEGMEAIMQLMMFQELKLTPKEQLKQMIELSFEHIKTNTAYWNLFISLILQPEVQKNIGATITKFREEAILVMAELFKQIGSKNPTTDAFSLGSQLDGIALNYVAAPKKFPIDEMQIYLIEKYCK